MTAGKIIVCGGLLVLLYVAHVAFVPVALALLFSLVLSGPVEALHRWRVPRSVSALVILMLFLGGAAGVVSLMWNPAQQWFAAAPQTTRIIREKITPISRAMNKMDELRRNVSTMVAIGRPTPAPAPAVAAVSAPQTILDVTGGAIVSALTFMIITLFLLTGGPPMLARMTAAFADDLNAAYVLNIIEKVRGEVGRFYVTTALINLGLGCATAAAMLVWGMPTPYLWGALAAVLNFIPYAGSATTLIVITLVAVVTFDHLGHILGVAGTYLVLATIEGQMVQPLLVGRRLELNPLLVFLALWFGGLYWGIAGIILATPALVALKVIAENARSGKSLMEFLGPNDQRSTRGQALRRLARRSA